MTTAVPLVSFADVRKHYGEGTARVDALRGVSFDVMAGEVVGLRGPSGSGKTTVLNIVGCILAPSEGTVRLDRRAGLRRRPMAAQRSAAAAARDHRLHLPVSQSAAVSHQHRQCCAGAATRRTVARSGPPPRPRTARLSRRRATAGTRSRRSSRAARRSASPSPARSLTCRISSWPTSPPPRSIRNEPKW